MTDGGGNRANEAPGPAASVVIPTRDRGADVVSTVASVLAGKAPAAVIIVDQSRDERTRRAVEPLLADSRVHYIRTPSEGISAALNVGIAAAATEYIAITGDDCEVAADWLPRLLEPFASDPAAGVIFGNVLPGLTGQAEGFTPSYVREEPAVARSLRDKHRVGGTSASMGLRRTVWCELSGFDEALGVGAPLGSAEDTDFAIRALLAGYTVRETPAATVVHKGYFAYSQREALIRRNWYGTGAAFVKPLRMGQPEILVALLRLAFRWAAGRSRIALGLGDGPHRLTTLASFLRGAWAGAALPVDTSSGHFRPRAGL